DLRNNYKHDYLSGARNNYKYDYLPGALSRTGVWLRAGCFDARKPAQGIAIRNANHVTIGNANHVTIRNATP
ncbi:MAG TPA: hypothetical protein VF387_00210, partial [Gemmatimonadaceae bacterium]